MQKIDQNSNIENIFLKHHLCFILNNCIYHEKVLIEVISIVFLSKRRRTANGGSTKKLNFQKTIHFDTIIVNNMKMING